MEKFLKFIGLLTLVSIIIFLIVERCNKSKSSNPAPFDQLTYIRITDSTKAAVLRGEETRFAIIEQLYKDSIAKIYKTKPKFIREAFQFTQSVDTDLKPVGDLITDYYPVTRPNCPPVPKSMTQDFSSEFYDAKVRIGDSAYLKLQGVDVITGVWTKKKNVFEFIISNSNPDITIAGVKAFRSPEVKQKTWSIGVNAGYGAVYSNGQFRLAPYFGIGINKSIISLR